MDILLKSFAVVFSLLFLSYSHTTASDTQMTLDEFLKVCNELCTHGPACPQTCPQRRLGPWDKRSLRYGDKRYYRNGFNRNSGLRGYTFDDYGLFMKYLGRNM